MKELKNPHILFIAALIFASIGGILGNRWGTPSEKRAELVLDEAKRTPEFYASLAESRGRIYEARETNPVIDVKEISLDSKTAGDTWRPIPESFLLHSYSSFLVRSMDGDEQIVLNTLSQIKPGEGKFAIKNSLYGGVYVYSLGAFLMALKITGALTLVSDITFYYQTPAAMAAIFSAARAYSVLAGLAALIMLYVLGCKVSNRAAAGLACLLFACSPVFTHLTHVTKPHLAAAAAGLALIYCAISMLNDPRRFWSVAGGICAGLAVGATTNAYPLALAFPAVLLWQRRFKEIIFYGAAAAAAFCAGNFGIFLNLKDFIAIQSWLAKAFTPVFNPLQWLSFLAPLSGAALGWPTTLAALGGIFFAFKKKEPLTVFLSVVLFFYSLWFAIQFSGTGRYYTLRYFVPGWALASILAAHLLISMAKQWKIPAYAAAGLITLYQAAFAACQIENFRRDSPAQALNLKTGAWINSHVPPRSKISTYLPTLDQTPPFRFADYHLYNLPAVKPDSPVKPEADYFILSMDPVYANTGERLDAPKYLPYADFERDYELKRAFMPELCAPCKTLGFKNYLSSANYPFFIYKRRENGAR